jgi:hypothetical protein
MFHLSFFGSVVKVAEFEDELFLGGCNDQKLTFLNFCPDGRSETADVKISSKRIRLTTYKIDLKDRRIMNDSFIFTRCVD